MNFRQFNAIVDVVNLDFLGVFVGSSCSFSVPPLHRFLLHMAIPLLLGVSLFSAYMTTRACCRTRACGGRQYSNEAVDDLRGGGGDGGGGGGDDGSGQNQKIRAAERIQNIRWMTTTKSFMLFLLMMYPRYVCFVVRFRLVVPSTDVVFVFPVWPLECFPYCDANKSMACIYCNKISMWCVTKESTRCIWCLRWDACWCIVLESHRLC
jgi:hypothetical protein